MSELDHCLEHKEFQDSCADCWRLNAICNRERAEKAEAELAELKPGIQGLVTDLAYRDGDLERTLAELVRLEVELAEERAKRERLEAGIRDAIEFHTPCRGNLMAVHCDILEDLKDLLQGDE